MTQEIPAAWAPFAPESPTSIEARRAQRLGREAYEAIDAVNWSTLKHLGKSPAHYLHGLTDKSGDSEARQRGRVLHLAIFEPERMARDVVVFHEARRGKAWEAFEAKHAGKEIVTSRMYEHVTALAAAVRTNAMAARYVSGGLPEHTVTWRYRSAPIEHIEGHEFACKGRLDFIADLGAIVDLKGSRDGSPGGFAREVLRYEYHAQAAFYADGYEAMTGVRLPFVFVVVEASAPHVVQVYRVPDDVLELGRERYQQLLAHLNVCRRESRWPGYAETEMELVLPRWARPLEDDDALDADLVIGE